MDFIKVTLLNTPSVYKNEENVTFPFRKAEALFYYLVVNKKATRDELVNLLWGEMDEETAKKNLRHAMYKIRKTFNMDIVISPQKSTVMINPALKLESDVELFLHDQNNGISVYHGEFLQGFGVKDGEEFERWMVQHREYLQNLYVHKLYQRIQNDLSLGAYLSAQYYGKLLISIDPFDEKAHRLVMEGYSREGAYHKALDVYDKLVTVLDQELGVPPDGETNNVMEGILALQNEKMKEMVPEINQTLKEFFYGRRPQLQELEEQFKLFLAGNEPKSWMIVGEAGIGKSKLKGKFVDNIHKKEIFLLESNCYQAEEGYYLKPWNDIFEKIWDIIEEQRIQIPPLWRNIIAYLFPIFGRDSNLSDINPIERLDPLKYQVAEEAIQGIFKMISKKKKILLVFEDLQWMDRMSLSLLTSILLHKQNSSVMVLATCRNGYGKNIEAFVSSLIKYEKLGKMKLERFSLKETMDFVQKALPDYPWKEEMQQKIYEETEGNTFFLMELLNSLKEKGEIDQWTPKMQDIISGRFVDIKEESKKILNIVSIFFDKAPLEMIKSIMKRDELEILDDMEELQRRDILKEIGDGESIHFEFTHQKLREFIYFQQSLGRRKILHQKIGSLLEKNLRHDKRDRLLYSRLIYHFYNGGNKLTALKYRIKNLDGYLDLCHEVIPLFSEGCNDGEKYAHIGESQIILQLEETERFLKEIKREPENKDQIVTLEVSFLHMKGRYFIWQGEYDKGTRCIGLMIEKSTEIGDRDHVLKGYRQMINYGIQTHDVASMKSYVDLGLDLLKGHGLQKEKGIFLRLKGLNKIMAGKYDEAEEMLKESIGIFQAMEPYEDRYILNIAAAYCYIGEIRRHNMKFSSALQYYDKAIALCQEKNVIRGIALFYSHGGQAALDMGDYLRAEEYLQRAIQLYNQLDTLWGRSTAEGYMALILIKRGDYSQALDRLKRAEIYGKKLKSPYELGLIERVKAEISGNMPSNKELSHVFGTYLNLRLTDYCNQGIKLLKQVKEPYEIEILRILKRNSR